MPFNLSNVAADDLLYGFDVTDLPKVWDVLNERESEILSKLYGLNGIDKKDRKTIGRELDISHERVRQIMVVAQNKLMRALANRGIDEIKNNTYNIDEYGNTVDINKSYAHLFAKYQEILDKAG